MQSITECMPSDSIAELPVKAATINLVAAITASDRSAIYMYSLDFMHHRVGRARIGIKLAKKLYLLFCTVDRLHQKAPVLSTKAKFYNKMFRIQKYLSIAYCR